MQAGASLKLFLAATPLAASACGTTGDDSAPVLDCSAETGTDVFVVGLEKAGAAGALDFRLMSATPAPPARGDNRWVVELKRMSSGVVGAPLAGATLTVTPFMPAHQHGSPVQVVVNETADAGTYSLESVNLWMPGVWETTIRATTSDASDSVVYKFCID